MSSHCLTPILTRMVIIMLLISATAATEQYDPNQTWEFIEKGTGPTAERQVFGRILADRDDGFLVEIDAPWENRRVVTLRDDMLESGPLLETGAMREKRIEEGWAARGFTKVTTAEGQTAFVVASEVELAKRARRAGLAAEPPDPDYIPPEALAVLKQPAPPPEPAGETTGTPFPWAKRAAQTVLLFVTLVLAFVLARTTILREN